MLCLLSHNVFLNDPRNDTMLEHDNKSNVLICQICLPPQHYHRFNPSVQHSCSLDLILFKTTTKTTQGLMIPNKKRAQRLDDRLRELGFHARASGIYKTNAASSAVASPASATGQQRRSKPPGAGGEPGTSGKKGRRRRRGSGPAASSRPLTQEEKQESLAKMVEACKKKRPGTAAGATDVDHR